MSPAIKPPMSRTTRANPNTPTKVLVGFPPLTAANQTPSFHCAG
jgi:hypothetical protein